MQISDEAVEAAAKRLAGARHGLWELTPEQNRRVYLRDARLALEAAVPFIAAEAWHRGYVSALHNVEFNSATPNPYRSQEEHVRGDAPKELF